MATTLSAPSRTGKRPPGRRIGVFDGELFRLRGNPQGFVMKIAREFGPIGMAHLGPLRLCVLNDPEYVKAMFNDREGKLLRGGWYHMAKSILGEGLITTSDGPFHRRQRRMAQPAFVPKRIGAYGQQMVDSAAQMRDEWQEGETREFYDEMSRLTLDISTRTLFGTDVEEDVREVRDAVTVVLDHWNVQFLPLAVVLHSVGIPYRPSRGLRRARKNLDRIIYRIIARRREEQQVRDDLLSLLVHARDQEGDGEQMTDLQLRDEAMTFFLAGHETVATTLTWAWYCLSQNPEVEAKLMDEVDRVLGGRTPTPADVAALDYTRRFFTETMRLYPAVWSISRSVREDWQVGDYVVPRNWQILASPYVVQRNPKLYPDPERVDPDRWLPEERAKRPHGSYFPFGLGQRLCIGEPFAMLEGPLVMATLAQRWRPVLVPDHKIDIMPGIMLRPKYGMPMRLERRRAPARKTAGTQPVAS